MSARNHIAANCRRLRTTKGWTQQELAQKVGLSRPGYLKIEQGVGLPRADTLDSLARAFKVSIEDLVRPFEGLEFVRFRTKKRFNSRNELLAEVKRRLDTYELLLDALGLEIANPEIMVHSDAKTAARLVRDALLREKSQDPIDDICGLVESAGYRLLLVTLTSAFQETSERSDLAEGFFGLSVLGQPSAPTIVVINFERITVERRIFTVAHELGHLHLHKDSYSASDSKAREEEEREADVFASHFLMPEEQFRREWQAASGLPFLERVLKVKRRFRVSYKTVLRRLEDEGEGKELFPKFLTRYKIRFNRNLRPKEEPNPLDEFDFIQVLLPTLVRQADERELLSHSKAAELLGLSLQEFREVARGWNI